MHRPCRIGKTESPKEEIVTKEIGCPMRENEIGERRNRTKSQYCGVDVELLWILKRKAYKI